MQTGGFPLRRLYVAGALPLAILLVCFVFGVPLGQPDFVIRYSSLLPLRVEMGILGVAIGLAGWVCLVHATRLRSQESMLRKVFYFGSILFYAALVLWTYVAPPGFVQQHAFNMLSPSQDGAFLLEAKGIASVRSYVTEGFYERLRESPEGMRGRRVLSNPPGMTVLCSWALQSIDRSPALRQVLVDAFDLGELDAEQKTIFAAGLLIALGMTLAWGLSLCPAYWLARLWLPPPSASAIAFASVFNPAAVTYTPGKDPMQLLTALLIAYFVSAAALRGAWLLGALAGLATVLGLMVGLVHVWVLIVAMAAMVLVAMSSKGSTVRLIRGLFLPWVIGFFLTGGILYALTGWNILASTYHVGVRYGQIQLPIITDPFYWTLVGLPLFLLFAGPMLWAQTVGLPLRPEGGNPARRAWLICTTVVLIYAYFFANNSETPRLWIPFIPFLVLGLSLGRRLFRVDEDQEADVCAKLVLMQLLVTLAMWALLDVRESEWRLITQRMWN